MRDALVRKIQEIYPLIYFAAHQRHDLRRGGDGELSESDYQVLVHVNVMAQTGTKKLAGHLGLQMSTVSEKLSYLTDLGLLYKRQDNDDRRRFYFELTDAGKKKISSGSVLDTDLLKKLLGSLSQQEMGHIAKSFELLEAAIAENTALEDSV